MDLLIVIISLFYCVFIEAKEFLRTDGGDDIGFPKSPFSEESPHLLGLIIFQHKEEPEASNETLQNYPSDELEAWDGNPINTNSSSESDSDEYDDTGAQSGTDSDSNYYHEDDYDAYSSESLESVLQDQSMMLRKWKCCLDTAAKICRKACVAAYKNACDSHSCKKKLKKSFKKQCKRNCKDFFS